MLTLFPTVRFFVGLVTEQPSKVGIGVASAWLSTTGVGFWKEKSAYSCTLSRALRATLRRTNNLSNSSKSRVNLKA